jgi:hypothetical protein
MRTSFQKKNRMKMKPFLSHPKVVEVNLKEEMVVEVKPKAKMVVLKRVKVKTRIIDIHDKFIHTKQHMIALPFNLKNEFLTIA